MNETPWPPTPLRGHEQIEARYEMVEKQLIHPPDGRTPITNAPVLEAILAVPRHRFVPEADQDRAHVDRALPIACEQTISQPYIVALMTDLLQITPEKKVLDVGTGSGYEAAILAHLTPHVYSIEILPELAEQARLTLFREGYDCINLKCGDGYLGWPEAAPFDAILVACAELNLPEPLVEQLAPGGRMIVPIEEENHNQKLLLITKDALGNKKTKSIIPVRFVPMTHYS